jgi:hypothetical protein
MENEILSLISPFLNDIQTFLFPNTICIIINSVILFVLVVTFLVSRFTIWRYKRREKLALDKIQRKVEGKLSRLEVPMESRNDNGKVENEKNDKLPDLLINLFELREGVNKKSIIYKRISTIESLRKYRVKINSDFLQQTTITSEAKRLGTILPGFSTKFAMILGLFGTFIGLALMVTKINMLLPNPNSLTFSISSLQSSITSMGTVFQGIKTAFSTSIVGIFTTLICLYLNFRIYRNQTSFFHELEAFTVEKLIPVTVPAVQGEHPLENIAFQLQDSFDDIEIIISQNKDTIENLGTIQSSFKTIVDEVRDITKSEASRNFEGVLTLLTKTNDSITSIVKQWPEIIGTIKKHDMLTERKIESLINVVKKNQETFDKELNRIVQVKRGGMVWNFPSVSNVIIVISSIVIITTLMISC